MSVAPPGGRRSLLLRAAVLLLAAAVSLPGSVRAQEKLRFPLGLHDPVKGAPVELAAGPKVTHLVFFATWCPPCLAEMPRLQELQATWGRRGYRLVLVAVGTRQTAERVRAFATGENPPGTVLLDADGSAQKAAGVEALPAHLLVGPDGAVLLRAGAVADGVGPALDRLLGGRRG